MAIIWSTSFLIEQNNFFFYNNYIKVLIKQLFNTSAKDLGKEMHIPEDMSIIGE